MLKKHSESPNNIFNDVFLNVTFFVCSIMVIGIHSYNITDTTINTITGYVESFLCHGIFTAPVPIFFFLSGFLFFRNISTTTDVLKKLRTRAKSVLMPFLVWSTIYVFIFTIFPREEPSLAPIEILKNIIFYKFCFPLWYLYQLIMFLLITPLINILIKKRYLSLCLLLILTFVAIFIKDSIEIEMFPNNNRSLFQINYFCYYFAGCLAVSFSDTILKIKHRIDRQKTLVAFVSGILLILFGFAQSIIFEERIPFFYDRFFCAICSSFIFCFLVVHLYKNTLYKKCINYVSLCCAPFYCKRIIQYFFRSFKQTS